MIDHGSAIKLRITFEDGVTLGADGADATTIWKWLASCEAFVCIRNGPANQYEGPYLKEIMGV